METANRNVNTELDFINNSDALLATRPALGRVRTFWNASALSSKGIVNTEPSKTIPDQVLPLKEILSRFAKGIPYEAQTPIYLGEEGNGIDLRTLDLSEQAQLLKETTDFIRATQHGVDLVDLPETKPAEETPEG